MIARQKLAGMLTSPGRYTACLTMKVVLLRLRRLLHFSPRSYSPPRPRMPQTREAFPLSSHTRLYSLLKRPRLGRPCTARQHPCRRCVAAGTSSSQNHGRSSRTSGISTLLCLSSSPSTGTQTPWPASPARVDASREDRGSRPMSPWLQRRTSEYRLYFQRAWEAGRLQLERRLSENTLGRTASRAKSS